MQSCYSIFFVRVSVRIDESAGIYSMNTQNRKRLHPSWGHTVQYILNLVSMSALFLIAVPLAIAIVIVSVRLDARLRFSRRECAPDKVKDITYDYKTEMLSFKGAESGDTYEAKGGGTVWRSMSGRRFDSLLESAMSDILD